MDTPSLNTASGQTSQLCPSLSFYTHTLPQTIHTQKQECYTSDAKPTVHQGTLHLLYCVLSLIPSKATRQTCCIGAILFKFYWWLFDHLNLIWKQILPVIQWITLQRLLGQVNLIPNYEFIILFLLFTTVFVSWEIPFNLKVGTNENGSACGRWLSIGI